MSNNQLNKTREELFDLSAKKAEAEARGDKPEAERIGRLHRAKEREMRETVKPRT